MSYTQKGECRNTGRTHFRKGFTPWNKNRTGVYSEETLFKIGSLWRGKSSPRKGKHHTEEAKEKIRRKMHIILLGNTRSKGKPWSEARRKAQEARCKLRPNKPVIRNGREYPPFWNEHRKLIYRRDNWTCQECGVKCHNQIQITCHHIDYDIKNNDPSNLVTLCASCHGKTGFHRKDWIEHFLTIQNRRMESNLSIK